MFSQNVSKKAKRIVCSVDNLFVFLLQMMMKGAQAPTLWHPFSLFLLIKTKTTWSYATANMDRVSQPAAALQPGCEEMEKEWGNEEEMEREWGNGERMRKWRGNGERMRKWTENEEMDREWGNQQRMGKWKENEEMEREWYFLILSPFPLNFLIFSPFPLHFLILSPFPRSPAARLQRFLQPWRYLQ